MNIRQTLLTEDMAREVCNWKYEGEYSVYNYLSWDEMVLQGWSICREDSRQKSFIGLVDQEDNLVAAVQLQDQGDDVQLGINLKPELCGQGLGKKVIAMTLAESRKRYPNKPVMLEVRAWNKRAINCYKSQGFEITGIKRATKGTDNEYYIMECKSFIQGT
jgi:[ribosomal protein S18]-alanine N-acetyltransferase